MHREIAKSNIKNISRLTFTYFSLVRPTLLFETKPEIADDITNHKIASMPADGIGPEVVHAGLRVL